MALSAEQKKKLERLGLVVLGGLAGVFAEAGGVLGKIAKLVLTLTGLQ